MERPGLAPGALTRCGPVGAPANRTGATLAVAVLLLLALLALAQGMLSLARLELAASSADLRMLRARAAAEVGLLRSTTDPLPTERDSVGLWRTVAGPSDTLTGATYRVDFRRLSREIWMARSVGRPSDGRGAVRFGRLLWLMDPLARVGSARATIEVGADAPLRIEGRIDGDLATTALPPLLPNACSRWSAALDSLLPAGRLPAFARVRMGEPSVEPSLGRLDAAMLVSLVPGRITGAGTPGPVVARGHCATADVWNWGEPLHPATPCGRHEAVVAADGSLTVRGGVGQGVLIVTDTLTLTDSARFYGLILVGGPLRLGPDVHVTGLVRAAGGADLAPGAEVDASACAVLLALSAATDLLGHPVPLPGPERIGPF